MKKRLLVSTLLISGLLGVITLNAQSNGIKIVSENDASKPLSEDGARFLNTINKSKSDLAKGKLAVDIIIDNSKNTEVFYVIDNSSSMSSIKGNVIDKLKSNAEILETRSNVTQGVVYTTNDSTTLTPLDSKNIGNTLDNVKSSASSTTNGGIFDSLEQAVSNFSTNEGIKAIVLVVNNLGDLTTEEINNLKSKVASYASRGIQIFAYDINMTDKTNFSNIFSTSTRVDLDSSDLSRLSSTAQISNLMPSPKNNIATVISYYLYILNNFDIKDITATKGTASFDNVSQVVSWNIPTIESNEKVTLTYYLQIHDVVDSSIVELEKPLEISKQVKVSSNGVYMGTYPSDEKIGIDICNPTIKVLKEALVNPQTGVAEYVVAGACMLVVAVVTLVIMNKKNEFNRI